VAGTYDVVVTYRQGRMSAREIGRARFTVVNAKSLVGSTDFLGMSRNAQNRQQKGNQAMLKISNNGWLELDLQEEDTASVRLQLYDIRGQLVLAQETQGTQLRLQAVDHRGSYLANGVYFYSVTVKGSNSTIYSSQMKKLIVLR
jgi:hypothetical protein